MTSHRAHAVVTSGAGDTMVAVWAALAGCGGADLSVSPTALHWGEVDFQQERPAAGYAAQSLVLRNASGRDLDVEIHDFDSFHLLLGVPRLAADTPPTLPPIAGGTQTVITVGVAAYDLPGGERETTVSGRFTFEGRGITEPIPVDWSFVPVRNIMGDTAE